MGFPRGVLGCNRGECRGYGVIGLNVRQER